MSVSHIFSEKEKQHLSQDDLDDIAEAEAAVDRIGKHLGDWLKLGKGFMAGRKWALAASGAKEPRGGPYNSCLAEWFTWHPKIANAIADPTVRSKVLAMCDPKPVNQAGESAEQVLNRALKDLSPGQQSRITSPVTACQHIDAQLKRDKREAAGEDETKPEDLNAPTSVQIDEQEAKLVDALRSVIFADEAQMAAVLAKFHKELPDAPLAKAAGYLSAEVERRRQERTDKRAAKANAKKKPKATQEAPADLEAKLAN